MTGRRGLAVDVGASQGYGGAIMTPFAEANPEGEYWELTDPAFRYGEEGPWEDLEPPPGED